MRTEEKAQISLELIVIMAAVLAIVLVLVSQLQQTGVEGAQRIQEKTQGIFNTIDGI